MNTSDSLDLVYPPYQNEPFSTSGYSSEQLYTSLEVNGIFNFNFDVLGIGQEISGVDSASQNIDAFVKNLPYTAFYDAGQAYHCHGVQP